MTRCIEDATIPVNMFSLLYALPNTQLTRRLEREGRLHAGELSIAPMWAVAMDIAPKYSGSASGMMNFGGGGLAAITSPLVFGYLIDFTGSWTLPFAGSLCLLLLGAGLAFRMRPDRPFETAVTARIAPVAA